MNIEEFVEKIRSRLISRADEDSYESYVYGHTLPGFRLGYGLVELGEVAEAKQWFRALASTYCDGAEYTLNSQFGEERSHAGALPENAWHRALNAAIMTGDKTVTEKTGQRVYNQITQPPVDTLDTLGTLDGREEHARIDTDVALAALLADKDTKRHIEAVRSHARAQSARETPLAWEGIPFNIPHADLIEGLVTSNQAQVEDGIAGLVQFHDDHRRKTPDIHDIEQEIDFTTTAAVVLARSSGHDVEPESEYVPSAIYDPEHYPLGWRT